MLPLFCYCQLDNFAWGTRGIDASEANGEGSKDLVEKKPYEVCAVVPFLNLLLTLGHKITSACPAPCCACCFDKVAGGRHAIVNACNASDAPHDMRHAFL